MVQQDGMSYRSYTVQKRLEALVDPTVQDLLKGLPEHINQKLVKAYIGNDHSGPDAIKILDHFLSQSHITRAVVEDKGGADIFYYLYNKIADNSIDRYLVSSRAGHQIYRRLKVMEEKIPHLLRTLFPGSDPITIDNIGSGQGYDMINVLADSRNSDLRERVHVRNIDPNAAALEVGMQRIKKNNLSTNFELVNDTIGSYKGREADFIVASGIFCPLSLPLSIRMMKNSLSGYARQDGYILYNATTMKMIEGDPFTDFIMRVGGWYMHFKTINDIKAIAVRSKKWKYVSDFYDTDDKGNEVGYNYMVVAKRI